MQAGRGFGKTRVGAEESWFPCAMEDNLRWAVIAPTHNDLRRVCFEGESGLLACCPREVLLNGSVSDAYNRSLCELTFATGSKIFGYSAEDPNRLRGPQHHGGWGDEIAAWKRGKEVHDMFTFGLRLGRKPLTVYTTTPRPVPLVQYLVKGNPHVVITRGSSYDNRDNLAPTFFEQLTQYEGTTLGRQEIHAELIDPEEMGIFKRSWFRLYANTLEFPRFELLIASFDTAFTDKTQNDPTACTVWGVYQPFKFDQYGQLVFSGGMRVLLCDAWREHLRYPDLRARVMDAYETEYGQGQFARRPDVLLIEDKGSGTALQQELQEAGLPIFAYNPGRADKTMRAHGVSHLVKNGLAAVPESLKLKGKPRTWVEPFLSEVCAFSGEGSVEHDDFVDTFTQTLTYLRDNRYLDVTRVEPREIEEDDYHAKRRSNPYAA